MYTEDVKLILEATISTLEQQPTFPASLLQQLKAAYAQGKLHEIDTLRQMLADMVEGDG